MVRGPLSVPFGRGDVDVYAVLEELCRQMFAGWLVSVVTDIRVGLIRWRNQRSTGTGPNEYNSILVGSYVLGAGRASNDD